MATLRNVNGASLVPDFSQGLNNLFKGLEARKAQEAEQAKQQQVQELIGQLSGQPVGAASGGGIDQGNGVETYGIDVPVSGATQGFNPHDESMDSRFARPATDRSGDAGFSRPDRQAALMRLISIDPKVGKEVAAVIESGDQSRITQMANFAKEQTRTALLLKSEPTREGRQRILRQIGEQAVASGDQALLDTTLRQMNMSDDELDLDIRRGMLKAADVEKIATDAAMPKEQFETVTDENGNIIGQRSTKSGKMVSDPRGVKTEAQLAQSLSVAKASAPVTFVDARAKAQAKGLTAEQEALAKARVNRYNELNQSALTAEEQNEALSQLENIDTKTGFGIDGRAAMASVINGLGGNGEAIMGVDPANVQAFNAVSGKAVLEVMSKQKGNQTDRDQSRIAKTLPTINNEAKANKFVLNSVKALNLRRIERRDFYEKYLNDKETLAGADQAWSKFKRSTPLVSEQIKDPETGLPMFFHQFKGKAKQANPGVSDEQVAAAWRELTE